MEKKIEEMAAKIYARTAVWDETEIRDREDNLLTREDLLAMNGTRWDGIDMAKLRLRKQAQDSITAAQVFWDVAKKDMLKVEK